MTPELTLREQPPIMSNPSLSPFQHVKASLEITQKEPNVIKDNTFMCERMNENKVTIEREINGYENRFDSLNTYKPQQP